MRPVAAATAVFPAAKEKAANSKAAHALPADCGPTNLQNSLYSAWNSAQPGPARAALVGGFLPPYQESEACCLSLSACVDAARFVTARLGPVCLDGSISYQHSVKITGEWRAGEDLEWLIRGVPLRAIGSKSPSGFVACRFKIWATGKLSRRWVGRTPPVGLPAPPHVMQVGELELIVAACRGVAAEAAAKRGARIIDYHTAMSAAGGKTPTVSPSLGQPVVLGHEFFGREIIRVISERQWGIAVALLHELRLVPEERRRMATAETDGTRRTALRLCVDGQREERAPGMHALEKGQITALLGTRRPYWWSMRIDKICHRTLSFLGQVWVGMPRPKRLSSAIATPRPWTAPAAAPDWEDVRWSEPQDCQGNLEGMSVDLHMRQLGRLRMGADTELMLYRIPPGESAAFGPSSLRNPLCVPMLAAQGRIAGALASGIFDPRSSARLAAELENCGPREAGTLTLACGADPRALADDGLSPFTSAILGEDPCGLLNGLDSSLRARILRGDALAWAEAGRSRAGAGHADMVAAPLTRDLAVPDELTQGLLQYCFRADLPLLAVRALGRVDGQNYLMAAVERAGDPQWLRAAERILQQTRSNKPVWCSGETLTYAVSQIRQGRHQFRLLLSAFLARIRRNDDFYANPASLASTGGAECPICFEPLCRGIPMAFADDESRAVCPHFLCSTCARGYAASASSSGSWLRCPECRRSAPKVTPLPRLGDDPLGWFDFLANTMGLMPRSTLVRAISAMLPIDTDKLGAAVDAGSLIDDGSGEGHELGQEITAAEFLSGGFYAWVWRHDEEHRRCSALGPLPDMTDRAEWFRYWNLRGTGALSRGEVLRAVLRTLEVCSLDRERVADLRRRVDRLWDGAMTERHRRDSHSSSQALTCIEFSEAGGLGDALEESFGMDFAKGSAARMSAAQAAESDPTPNQHWPRPDGPRRRRGQSNPSSAETSAAETAPSSIIGIRASPLPSEGAASAAAGVLGMFDPPASQTLSPSGGRLGGSGNSSSSAAAMAIPSLQGRGPCGPEERVDAMAALEGLERDLANSPRRHYLVSI